MSLALAASYVGAGPKLMVLPTSRQSIVLQDSSWMQGRRSARANQIKSFFGVASAKALASRKPGVALIVASSVLLQHALVRPYVPPEPIMKPQVKVPHPASESKCIGQITVVVPTSQGP
eukprot:3688706-Amphidinium_carterae.1